MSNQEDKKKQTESEYDDDVLAMLGLDGAGKAKPKSLFSISRRLVLLFQYGL